MIPSCELERSQAGGRSEILRTSDINDGVPLLTSKVTNKGENMESKKTSQDGSAAIPASPSQRRKSAIASILGTTIEWYDYFLYGSMAALVFNEVFFANLDPVSGTIAAFGTFAVAFIIRPFGAAFFGQLGDKKGRTHALLITLVVMGVSTVAIGFLPTYESMGVLAPAMLMILRMGQGFAAGGEWGGAVLLTFENSKGKGRGLMAALPGMGTGLGALLATGTVALLTTTLSDNQFLQWGWRIPFLASSVIIVLGIYMRLNLRETAEFEAARVEAPAPGRMPILALLRGNWRELLVVIGVRLGENGGYYIFATFAVAYAAQAGVNNSIVLTAISVAAAIQIAAIPFFGWLSDRLGRRAVYGFGAGLLAIWAWCFFALLDTGSPAMIFVAILVGIAVAHSAMFGPQSAFLAELFGVHVRYSGVALGHSLGAILGGGLAPLIATSLLAARGGDPLLVSIYVCALGVFTLFTLIAAARFLRGRASTSYSEEAVLD